MKKIRFETKDLGNDHYNVIALLPDGDIKTITLPLAWSDAKKLCDCLNDNFHNY